MKTFHYLKRSIAEAREHPVYTTIYVAAVAMSVMLTMIFAIYYFIQLGPVYPETNRNHTNYISFVHFNNIAEQFYNGYVFTQRQVKDLFYPMENYEHLTAKTSSVMTMEKPDRTKSVKFGVIMTDHGFFEVFDFDFLAGRPFSAEEFESGLKKIVMTDRSYIELFGGDVADGIGKVVVSDGLEYQITGIVREPSRLMTKTFANVYIPYTALPVVELNGGLMGPLSIVFTTKDEQQRRDFIDELETVKNKFHDQWPEWELDFMNQPYTHFESVFSEDYEVKPTLWSMLKENMMILFALILLPAINLSGMISGRMEGRVGEMGIRKSFGAVKSDLMMQVFVENLLMTLAGAAIGLTCAWIAIYFHTRRVIGLFSSWALTEDNPLDVSPDMLFSPSVFGVVLVVILVINLLSAIIPALISLRRPIVESLNQRK